MPKKDYPATMETMNHIPSNYDVDAPPAKYNPWSDFVDNTTLHGLRYVFRKKFRVLRLVWLLILITAGSYYMFIVFQAITKFLSYPVSTVLEQRYPASMKFPAVTICPQNMFQKSKIFMPDSDPEFNKLGLNMSVCEATAAVRAGRPCGLAMLCCCGLVVREKAVLSTITNCTSQYKSQLRQALNKFNVALNTREFYRVYGPDIRDILGPHCTFKFLSSDTCTVQDFSSFRVTGSGMCFTFNSGESQKIRSVVEAGISTGLNVALDSKIAEYTTGKVSQGFQVVVHEEHEFVDGLNGILVGPGSHIAIAVSKQKFVNLPSPYSTKCKNETSKMFGFYTIQGCLYECELAEVERVCGCHLVSYQGPLRFRYCDASDHGCQTSVPRQMNVQKCNCSAPCESVHYNTQVSYSTGFPNSWTSTLVKSEGYNQTLAYQRENLVFIQVGFKSLSYEHQEQVAAFDTWMLLGEIGGNMGLFVGCSLITLCELMDCLIIFLFQKFRNVAQR